VPWQAGSYQDFIQNWRMTILEIEKKDLAQQRS